MTGTSEMSDRTIYAAFLSAISSPGSEDGPSLCASPVSTIDEEFGQDHALANLSPRQALERGLLTSGTYGRSGFTSSESAVLTSSILSKLRPVLERNGSTLYRMTYKEKALPSGRSISQVQASVPRTRGSDSMQRSSWPTPSASDENDARGGYYGGRIREREGRPPRFAVDRLGQAVQLAGWHTPMAGTPAQNGNNPAGNTDSSRKTVALAQADAPARLTATGELLIGSDAGTIYGVPLNPEHSRWLQAYPSEWSKCAVMGMQSTSRLRKRSSKHTKPPENLYQIALARLLG